jgi:hypothetical protein
MIKVVTTSWDDGYPLDLRLRELLNKYGIKGTFYIPKFNPENPVMSGSEIRELAQDCEIGGHTYNHVKLTLVNHHKAKEEILSGKKYIEDLVGKSPKSFCFPGGRYNKQLLSEVIGAGYNFGRTTSLFQTKISMNKLMHTTLQMYSHRRFTYLKHCLKRRFLSPLIDNKGFVRRQNFLQMVQLYLEKIARQGGTFHLWGHSWEIQNNNSWSMLEQILRILSGRKDWKYLTNSEAWSYCNSVKGG